MSANAGDARDADSVPGLGISLGVRNGYPLQYSSLENSMDKRAWQAIYHEVTKSWIWLNTYPYTHIQQRHNTSFLPGFFSLYNS